MNPKKVFHNTAYSVQLPYIVGTPFKLDPAPEKAGFLKLRNMIRLTFPLFSKHGSV